MSDPTLLVLASLADGDKHGYAMMEDIERFAGVRLGPGTLYGAITRLEERGWIRPLKSTPVKSAEARRQPYTLTCRRPAASGRTACGLEPGCQNWTEEASARMTAEHLKRLARLVARLYPRRWRARYGPEFDALLEDANLTLLDVFGVVRSALEMRMESPDSPRLLDLACRDLRAWLRTRKLRGATATRWPNTMLVRSFYRQIDLGDSYLTLTHSSRGSGPAQTILICGKKGEVDGDFRTDDTEMLLLQPDGTVRRTEQTVKTWLKYDAMIDRVREKYRNGLSAEDIFRQHSRGER